ncbi:hypothetical protein [Natrinema sp. DC36]|uniref:DUF7287 family protein n=1 Tax=Natrinema sp. DC36 TaxID=2878680 RepID=UPI001CF09CD8|nr:hypothetical protein [Natrinema sp. DC36]
MIGKRTNKRGHRLQTGRPGTISVSFDERGQTTQDFAVGIGVFLLAIAFVFSFLPSVITPFDSSVGGAETAQADRIADLVVHNVSTETANEINGTKFNTTYANGNLTETLGLRSSNGNRIDRVNVRIEKLKSKTSIGDPGEWTAGDTYENQSAASSARIVTIDGDPSDCNPACRLVVRVW